MNTVRYIFLAAPFFAAASFAQSLGDNAASTPAPSANAPLVTRTVFSDRSFFPPYQSVPGIAMAPKQTSRTAAPEPKPRPRLQGSSTGYIENAIVGSEIRLRFDGDFNIQDPDRAEFFYAKCGCYSLPAAQGTSAYDPNAPGPRPGIAVRLNAQELHLRLEYAPHQRFSFFADIPERSIQFTSVIDGTLNNAGGFGDFGMGFKFAAVATDRTYVTFQLSALTPTGNAANGLGTAHYSVAPFLLLNHRLTDRVTVAAQFGDIHPIGGSAGVPTAGPSGFAADVLQYGLGGSYDFSVGSGENTLSPVLEFVGWNVRGGFATTATGTVSASGVNIVNGKFGFRYSFHTHHSIYAGFGEAMTNSRWYKEILRIEYRYSF